MFSSPERPEEVVEEAFAFGDGDHGNSNCSVVDREGIVPQSDLEVLGALSILPAGPSCCHDLFAFLFKPSHKRETTIKHRFLLTLVARIV